MTILNSNPTPDRNPNTIVLFHIALSQRKVSASMEVNAISPINMRKKLKKLRKKSLISIDVKREGGLRKHTCTFSGLERINIKDPLRSGRRMLLVLP